MTDDLWTAYRNAQHKRRAERLPTRTDLLCGLGNEGYTIEQKTPYHFRINGCLDIWPTHNRYHDLRRNKRGGFKQVDEFVRNFFKSERR